MARDAKANSMNSWLRLVHVWWEYEPPHDKTNKMTVRPALTQISLGICPVWSESSLSAWRKLGPLALPIERTAKTADAQADLSLRWAHSHFVGFVMKQLILYNTDQKKKEEKKNRHVI